ncbi:MAG: hypothetical protein LBM93_07645 [Oscillospiraceae bacterium]|nr:hypothetical protein [Oscillospiraceae bacterium]
MKKLKKLLAVVLAVGTLSTISAMNVGAATSAPWTAKCVNINGAGGTSSDTVTISQYQKGATAICNYSTHTVATATTGITTINCLTYSMSSKTITNIGSVILSPNVVPLIDINVSYRVSAYSPTPSDVFWSKGNIIKR